MLRISTRGNHIVKSELHAERFQPCKCGEINPSEVECPTCRTLNLSGHPCRKCNGPGGMPGDPWYRCPSCGLEAVHKGKIVAAYYANPIKQIARIWFDWLEAKGWIKRPI